MPINITLRHTPKVKSIKQVEENLYVLTIEGKNFDKLKVLPGQFFNFRFLTSPGFTQAHPFSLSAPIIPTTMEVTFKKVGDGTASMTKLLPGTRVFLEGPYGALTPTHSEEVIVIGAGTGMAPLKAIVEAHPKATQVIVRTKVEEGYFPQIFQNTIAPNITTILPGPRKRKSWLPAPVSNLVFTPTDTQNFYLCGPKKWCTHVETWLLEKGVASTRIHQETFGWE